jgi:hypothetical protein
MRSTITSLVEIFDLKAREWAIAIYAWLAAVCSTRWSSASLSGLARKSVIPASKQRARSSARVAAVSAMTGRSMVARFSLSS